MMIKITIQWNEFKFKGKIIKIRDINVSKIISLGIQLEFKLLNQITKFKITSRIQIVFNTINWFKFIKII